MNTGDYLPTQSIIDDCVSEAVKALRKHGPATTDPMRACNVLLEELGEAGEQALKLTSSNPAERESKLLLAIKGIESEIGLSHRLRPVLTDPCHKVTQEEISTIRLLAFRHELTQLAGYAMLQLRNIDLGLLKFDGTGTQP